MRGVATVASLFDDVAAFTERGADLLRNAQVFPLRAHPLKGDRMAALPELLQLLRMAAPALLRIHERLLVGGGLVIDMAGNAMDAFLRVLRVDPGLEEAGGPLLVA